MDVFGARKLLGRGSKSSVGFSSDYTAFNMAVMHEGGSRHMKARSAERKLMTKNLVQTLIIVSEMQGHEQ